MPATVGSSKKTLLLGGARSGKSRRALQLAEQSGRIPYFIATARAGDQEMADRITRHISERDQRWTTIEAPRDLETAILENAKIESVLVIDCLTFWLANLFFENLDVDRRINSLTDVVNSRAENLIFVSNEVGFGIVPDNALAREFRDAQGHLNQSIARACDVVELVVAGLPLRIKP